MKNMNFPWADDLYRKAGQQAALQDGPVGCTVSSRWAAKKGRRRAGLFCSPPRLFVHPAGLPFCAACRKLLKYELSRIFCLIIKNIRQWLETSFDHLL